MEDYKITEETFKCNGSFKIVHMGDMIDTNCGMDTTEVTLTEIIALLSGGIWFLDDGEYTHLFRATEEAKAIFKFLKILFSKVEDIPDFSDDSGITFREEIRHARMCDQ